MGRNKGSKNKVTLDRIKLKQEELLILTENYRGQLENIKFKEVQKPSKEENQIQQELTKTAANIKDNPTYKEYTLNENYSDPKKENKEITIEKKISSGGVENLENRHPEKVLPKKENIKPRPKSKYLFE